MNSKKISLSDVQIKNAVRVMMEDTEYDQFQKIAAALGKAKSTFQTSLDNETIRTKDLIKVADLLGYDLQLKKIR